MASRVAGSLPQITLRTENRRFEPTTPPRTHAPPPDISAAELARIQTGLATIADDTTTCIAELRALLDGDRLRADDEPICSFCDADRRHSAYKMIAGPRVFICDGCAAQATAATASVLRTA